MFKSKYIYLDYASTTPIDRKVLRLMSSYERDFYANATSMHNSGVKVRNIIEESRKKIAQEINAHSDEIFFTGSSTESNALAILGTVDSYKSLINDGNLSQKIIPHIVTSKIEHPAVLENCKILEDRGDASVTYLSVNKNGIIDLDELRDSIKENTILVSIMYANNEIGTIQPIQEIAKIIRHSRKINKMSKPGMDIFPIFHTDATQAINYLDTSNVEKLGIDMMSFNGSKIYGPKGIGVLYKKRFINLSPLYSGGGQESGLRSGTENVASIAGIALALLITNKMKSKESERLIKLRDYTIDKLLKIKIGSFKIILNGDITERLPNNINISVSGISSELLVIELDAKGIEVSSKSACKSDSDDGSYVIKAIRKICKKGNEEEGSLRITLGRQTTKKDIDKLITILIRILTIYSKFTPFKN